MIDRAFEEMVFERLDFHRRIMTASYQKDDFNYFDE
jgi:hypothetical protein